MVTLVMDQYCISYNLGPTIVRSGLVNGFTNGHITGYNPYEWSYTVILIVGRDPPCTIYDLFWTVRTIPWENNEWFLTFWNFQLKGIDPLIFPQLM